MAIADTIQSMETNLSNAYSSLEEKGATIPTNKNLENLADSIDSISGGGDEPIFTGHYDAEGLSQIGWSAEDIQYYQKNGVQWNEEQDSIFELDSDDLAGNLGVSTRFLPKNSSVNKFQGYKNLLAIPNNITAPNSIQVFFQCFSLTTIPLINTSYVTNFTNWFYDCYSLTAIPLINTSNVTNMSNMFYECYSLTTIPLINTSKVTSMSNMFNGCRSLKTIPLLNTSKVTSMSNMFNGCYSLKTIPLLNTSSVTDMSYMFNSCRSLAAIPLLDASNVTNINTMFADASALEFFGGLKDLGAAYSTTQVANYGYYTLNLSSCSNMKHDSLVNVINNLYDIATKGCNVQKVVLGSANYNKLSAEEIAVGTTKGWNITIS